MDLSKIIPDNEKWSYSKGIVYFKKIYKIPVCIFIDEVPHIILENKLTKQVIEITKNFMKSGQEFYFTTPDSSNPAGVYEYKREVIRSYFNSYANYKFLTGFNKINFDLIKNLIDWSDKNDCWYLVKPIYEEINKQVQKIHRDWYSNKDYYDYSYDVREEFRTLWREIQINKII